VLAVEGRTVRVLDIGIRATRVRSRDHEILIVPSSTLTQPTARSFTLLDPLVRARARVGVAYESDMHKVLPDAFGSRVSSMCISMAS
jgi:small-conductance mechanosensitive channel